MKTVALNTQIVYNIPRFGIFFKFEYDRNVNQLYSLFTFCYYYYYENHHTTRTKINVLTFFK